MARYKKDYKRNNISDRIAQRLREEDAREKLQLRLKRMQAEGRIEETKGVKRKILRSNLDTIMR